MSIHAVRCLYNECLGHLLDYSNWLYLYPVTRNFITRWNLLLDIVQFISLLCSFPDLSDHRPSFVVQSVHP